MAQVWEFCPVLMVDKSKAEDAVQFYKEAFGALELERRNSHLNGELFVKLQLIGSANIMVIGAEPYPLWIRVNPFWSMDRNGGSVGGVFYLATEDVEATMAKAVAAGGVQRGLSAPGGKMLEDPFGYIWLIRPAV